MIIDSFRAELWQALRSLRRTPGLALMEISLLALSIGAAATIHGVARGVLLRPLPFPEGERLYGVIEQSADGKEIRLPDYPTFRDWQRQNTAFTRLAYVRGTTGLWRTDAAVERIVIAYVSSAFFPLLARAPLIGRVLTATDDAAGERVAVVSYQFWRERLGGVASAAGTTLTINGEPTTVVGVMPPGTTYPEWTTLWMPLASIRGVARSALEQRGVHADGRLIGRLKPGLTAEAATVAMSMVTARLAAEYPGEQGNFPRARLLPLRNEVLLSSGAAFGDPTAPVILVGGAVALLLAIGYANLANLALARNAARLPELAVRAALGAGRGRVIRLLVIEALPVVALGGTLGVALAQLGLGAIRAHAIGVLPRVEEIRLDPVVVTVALLIGLAALLAIGLLPAWWGTGKDVEQALRSAGSRTGATRAQERLRGTLAGFQVALAVSPVVGAGLISRSLRRAIDVRPGFNPVALATLWVDPSATGATREPARLIAL